MLSDPNLIAEFVVESLEFRALRRVRDHFRTIELVSGGLLVIVGLLVLTDQLSRFNAYFGFLEEVVVRLEEALL